jgi:hypothetical protein
MKYLTFLLFFAIIGCSSKEIPKHKIIDYDVSERVSGNKTFVSANAIVYDSNINDSQLKVLLNHLYDSIMNTTGYEYRKKPNSCNIFVYPTIEHLNSGMGQWIGNIGKAKNDELPKILTQFIDKKSKKTNQSESEILKEISIDRQKEIWNEIILSEDKSNAEAEKKYPILVTGNTIAEINNQKEIAKSNSEKHYEYQESILKKYEEDLINEYNISVDILNEISRKGLEENWPFPN